MAKLLISLMVCVSAVLAQSNADSLAADSLKNQLFGADTMRLETVAPAKMPKNIARPVTPANPLEIDYRSSSMYTPRYVQDKLDNIMNRPRSDQFMPLPTVALIAASVAAKQLDLEKMFALNARDYAVPDSLWQIMILLWEKSPQTIETIYPLLNRTGAAGAQKLLERLQEAGLLKVRVDSEPKRTWYFPAQKPGHVKTLFQKALNDSTLSVNYSAVYRKRLAELEDLLEN